MPAEFCQPVPHSLAFDLLSARIQQLKEDGEKVPIRLCAASYLNDVLAKRDEEGVKKQADYARIWGYSPSWVSRHWKKIKAEAAAQKDFYQAQRKAEANRNDPQRQNNSAATRSQEPRKSDRPTGDTDGENGESLQEPRNAAATPPQEPSNTNRSHYSDCQKESPSAPATQAREGAPPDDHSPPDPPPLRFLGERQEPHRGAIEYAAGQMGGDIADPAQLAAQCETRWNRVRPITPYEVKQLLSTESGKYAPEVVLSAIVIAGDDNNPTKNFLHGILRDLHEQQQRTEKGLSPDTSSGSRGRKGRSSRGNRSRGRSGAGSSRKRRRGGWHGRGYA